VVGIQSVPAQDLCSVLIHQLDRKIQHFIPKTLQASDPTSLHFVSVFQDQTEKQVKFSLEIYASSYVPNWQPSKAGMKLVFSLP